MPRQSRRQRLARRAGMINYLRRQFLRIMGHKIGVDGRVSYQVRGSAVRVPPRGTPVYKSANALRRLDERTLERYNSRHGLPSSGVVPLIPSGTGDDLVPWHEEPETKTTPVSISVKPTTDFEIVEAPESSDSSLRRSRRTRRVSRRYHVYKQRTLGILPAAPPEPAAAQPPVLAHQKQQLEHNNVQTLQQTPQPAHGGLAQMDSGQNPGTGPVHTPPPPAQPGLVQALPQTHVTPSPQVLVPTLPAKSPPTAGMPTPQGPLVPASTTQAIELDKRYTETKLGGGSVDSVATSSQAMDNIGASHKQATREQERKVEPNEFKVVQQDPPVSATDTFDDAHLILLQLSQQSRSFNVQ